MNRAPYKYFDYYTSADADLFFGREKETQMMVGEILSSRLLVLFARSGSGKTSLINAGVVPELQRRGYETLYVRFESDPLTSLQNAAREQLQHAGAANDLRDLLQNVTAALKKPLVIFLDQFEEFFLVFADQPALRQDFIAQIASVKYDEQLPVFLVLSLREDYYASLHEFRSAIPSIFQNNANIRLGAFTDEEAKRAILLPLAAVGLQIEAGLAEKIIHDLKPRRNGQERREDHASGIEPITLQIVCHKLWQMKPRDVVTMTAAVYEKCGGAQKILRNHVSELLQKIPQRQQGLMVRIFEALKTRDNTKLYCRLQDLQETLRLTDSRRLKNALQKLAEIGVLRHEQRSGDDWYEFKHDYLVPEVAKWIQARWDMHNKRRLWYVAAPGVILLCGLLVYLIIMFNSFYFGISTPEIENAAFHRNEIAIFRRLTNQRMITTGYWLKEDTRGPQAEKVLIDHLNLGFWKAKDWSRLPAELNSVEAGVLLYHLDSVKVALRTLIVALKDQSSSVRAQATAALVNLGQSDDRVISALFTALKDQDSRVRSSAAAALGNLGKSDDHIIAALISALKDNYIEIIGNYYDPNIIGENPQITAALRNLGQSDDRVIAALLTALKDQDSRVRYQVVGVLGKLGKSNDRIIAALLAMLKDREFYIRNRAATALGNLGNSDNRIIVALLAALKDQDSSVRFQTIAALENLGRSDDDRIIAGLLAVLKDKNSNLRLKAAAVLGNLGNSYDRVIAVLFTVLNDEDFYLSTEAVATLGKLGKSNDRIIAALLNGLRDQKSYIRTRAAIALGNLGKSDDRIIVTLLTALKNQDPSLRFQAVAVLGNLGKSDDRIIAALQTTLKDDYRDFNDNYPVRSQAVTALRNLGENDDRIIAALLVVLKGEANDGRSQAASALGNLGKSDERVIAALLAALKDEVNDVRSQAAAALGKLLKPNPEDELFKLLASNLSGYRTASGQALSRKDSLPPALLNKIDQLRQDDRPWVRLAAWEAYDLIQARLESELKAKEHIRQADSLFATGQWTVAGNQYENAFDISKNIIRVDSAKTARAKFQQARCAAKLKRVVPVLDDLKVAFEYNPTLRDTLQAEMAQPENDWKILEGNWYLREVLIKKDKKKRRQKRIVKSGMPSAYPSKVSNLSNTSLRSSRMNSLARERK